MRPSRTFWLAASVAVTLAAGPGAALAAQIGELSLDLAVTNSEGAPVTTVTSGANYWYDVNYNITGSDLTGVGATITVDLPEGLWAREQNAPGTFTSSCTQAGSGQWKFSCEFVATDLGISGAGGLSGQARILVTSRRFGLAHGDTVTATGVLTASWEEAGDPQTMSDTGSHVMGFEATPEVRIGAYSTLGHGWTGTNYSMMAGPVGEIGVSYGLQVRLDNRGTAALNQGKVEVTLPPQLRIAELVSAGAWSLTSAPWSTGTITIERAGTWGHQVSPTNTQGLNEWITLRIWIPCAAFSTLRDQNGDVPEGMRYESHLSATGFGLHPDDPAEGVGLHEVSHGPSYVNPPNLTPWACGTGQARAVKAVVTRPRVGGTTTWRLHGTPQIASTYETDAVFWDALDPSLDSFRGVNLETPNDGTFDVHYCDLSDLTVTAPTARANFLGSWKDDLVRCSTAPPTGDAEWSLVSHIFFHAPSWGDPAPPEGYLAPNFAATITTRVPADAIHDQVVSNTFWYESSGVDLLDRSATIAVIDEAHPLFHSTIAMAGANPPWISPGEAITLRGTLTRNSETWPRNLSATVTVPDGLLYEGSDVVFLATCINNEAAETHPPGTWIPIDYTAHPTVTVEPTGSTTLAWSFGTVVNPYFLRSGSCIRIDVHLRLDPNRAHVNGAQPVTHFILDAENRDPTWGPHARPRSLTIQSPPEMRVDVVPWCEQQGRLGFNAVYQNSGGVNLTDVAVTFPIPETVDPLGGTPDVTHFAEATFDDPYGLLELSTDGGATWSDTPPPVLADVTHVRLRVSTLEAHSGPQGFFVDLTVPVDNPGDNLIHASGSMSAAQLNDASSPVSIPFLVGTCPQPLTITKFFDADGDGLRGEGEPVLPGWTFEVRDGQNDLVASGTTALDGAVTFILLPGSYTVTELLPDPPSPEGPVWSATTPGGTSQVVSVTIGGDNAVAFGNACACDDDDICTDALCDPSLGCIFNPVTCDDGDPCTAGACDAELGCQYTALPEGAPCDTGDACDLGSACDPAGACVPTSVVNCDDGDACTVNGACDPATGQCPLPVPIADGDPCDDGLACTDDNVCVAGICAGDDVCPDQETFCAWNGYCHPDTGACEFDHAVCAPERFYALVEDASGDVVGAIRCHEGAGGLFTCDRGADGLVVVYTDLLTCDF